RRAAIATGAAIASARRNQYAADTPFADFYAGAFTFVLTQYLWQQTGNTSFDNTIANVGRTTTELSFSNQIPELSMAPDRERTAPIYFTSKVSDPAEAVVTNITGGEVEVWLGGVDPNSLEVFGPGAVLSGVDETGQSRGQVQLTDRQGLRGRGRLIEAASLPSGSLLQEQVRGIPTDVTLRIGLDESLGADATIAQSTLATMPQIEPLALGGDEVHYVLGRMTAANRQELADQPGLPAEGSLGLFSQGLDLVPDSYGAPGETIAAAIERLRPKLRSLFAARLVKLTLNPGASRLKLDVAMIPEGGNQISANAFTVRSSGVEQIPLGTGIRFEIENQENRDLYLSVLVIDATSVMSVIFPNQWAAAVESMLLPAGARLTLPDPNRDSFQLVTQPPLGTTEVLIVASSTPLNTALQGLQAIADDTGVSRGPLGVDDPTPVIEGLLQDVSETSQGAGTTTVRSVSVTQLAAFSITFEIV
ncbi:MAG: DUF4384 domain-containing protein, partial [Cyanobacteria bacterium P01_D01_bin.115]